MFLKKNLKKIIYIIFLMLILVYVTNITSIPKSLILFKDEELALKTILGVKIEETIQVGAKVSEDNVSNVETKEYILSFLGLDLKKVTANIMQTTRVIPLGNLIGLKLNTKGVLVVGTSEIKGEDNKIYKPYEEAGINLGDSIIQINGEQIETTEELITCVSRCKGEKINIKYVSNGEVLDTTMKAVKTSDNTYKIGLWVRDASAGVGTLTFYDKSTQSLAALGHGIQDIDTGKLVEISTGEFVTTDIIDIEKGEKENPGKIEGTIEKSRKIGEIYSNTDFGIYGQASNSSELNINNIQEVEVASRNEIQIGNAKVICTLEEGKREEYEVEIQKIYINNNENNKSMLVKVTDERLLEKTGGIIQGMSGSPILQNGKLIGALTHVLVSDPTKGYGLFADTMVKELKDIN